MSERNAGRMACALTRASISRMVVSGAATTRLLMREYELIWTSSRTPLSTLLGLLGSVPNSLNTTALVARPAVPGKPAGVVAPAGNVLGGVAPSKLPAERALVLIVAMSSDSEILRGMMRISLTAAEHVLY